MYDNALNEKVRASVHYVLLLGNEAYIAAQLDEEPSIWVYVILKESANGNFFAYQETDGATALANVLAQTPIAPKAIVSGNLKLH